MSWIHNNKTITDISQVPNNAIGFVYIIENKDTYEYYIGKKSLYGKITKKPLKGTKKKRVELRESKWLDYQSSNKEVQQWTNVERKILTFAFTKTGLTYFEAKAIFCFAALEDNKSLNGNILGKFYKDKITEEFESAKQTPTIKLPKIES